MAKVTHTPGPWKQWDRRDIDQGILLTDQGGSVGVGRVIGESHDDNHPKRRNAKALCLANANLITAAPDMLVELRKVEWAGTIENQSARDPAGAGCCPCCQGVDPAYPWPSRFPQTTFGHAADCTLAATISPWY